MLLLHILFFVVGAHSANPDILCIEQANRMLLYSMINSFLAYE